jgi:hypothetical protein
LFDEKKVSPDDCGFWLLLLGRPVVHREATRLVAKALHLHVQNAENEKIDKSILEILNKN